MLCLMNFIYGFGLRAPRKGDEKVRIFICECRAPRKREETHTRQNPNQWPRLIPPTYENFAGRAFNMPLLGGSFDDYARGDLLHRTERFGSGFSHLTNAWQSKSREHRPVPSRGHKHTYSAPAAQGELSPLPPGPGVVVWAVRSQLETRLVEFLTEPVSQAMRCENQNRMGTALRDLQQLRTEKTGHEDVGAGGDGP